ncbi:MAG: hypothetical protein ACE5F9_00200 [Phycisphaerae bacterium]
MRTTRHRENGEWRAVTGMAERTMIRGYEHENRHRSFVCWIEPLFSLPAGVGMRRDSRPNEPRGWSEHDEGADLSRW